MMLASQLRNKPPIRVCMSDEGKGGKALGTGVKSGRQNVAPGVDKNTKGWNEVKDHNQSIRIKSWDYNEDVGEMIEEEEDEE